MLTTSLFIVCRRIVIAQIRRQFAGIIAVAWLLLDDNKWKWQGSQSRKIRISDRMRRGRYIVPQDAPRGRDKNEIEMKECEQKVMCYVCYLTTSLCMRFSFHNDYEWAKRTKFLLPVLYRLPRQHSNSSKNPLKRSEKMITNFMTILGIAESYKTMNQPDRIWI